MKLSDIFFINPEGFSVGLKTIAMMSNDTFFFSTIGTCYSPQLVSEQEATILSLIQFSLK